MKWSVLLLAGFSLATALLAQVANNPTDSKPNQVASVSENLQDRLVGKWFLSVTNRFEKQYGQWMAVETEYFPDGTFSLQGQLGAVAPAIALPPHRTTLLNGEPVNELETTSTKASGVWHLEDAVLFTTFTNGNWVTNVETRWKILSLDDREFRYQRIVGETNGPELKAIRKR